MLKTFTIIIYKLTLSLPQAALRLGERVFFFIFFFIFFFFFFL